MYRLLEIRIVLFIWAALILNPVYCAVASFRIFGDASMTAHTSTELFFKANSAVFF